MRYVRLFAADMIAERQEPGDVQAWPDGVGRFVPPALVIDPARVGEAYGIVFKPLRVIGGKTRIEYLWTGRLDRMHVTVRVSRGRIEAVRTERLDLAGRVAIDPLTREPVTSSVRIAYAVVPTLSAASPTCRT